LAGYRVNLEVFAGPLDLLLYLVRKEEVDIYDIPIARITEQYLRYIEMLKNLDIDLAGDFLVMAAMLMQIKSAMLLPKAEPEEVVDGQIEDPRAELVRQLLEYKKFKDAANLLDVAAEQRGQRFGRPDTIIGRLKPQAEPEIDLEQVSIWDLLEAFDALCRATGATGQVRQIQDETPIDLYQIEILHRLQNEGMLRFEQIFEGRSNRLVLVGLFLALLELIREGLVWAEQSQTGSVIYLRALTDEPAEQAVQKAIMAVAEDKATQPQQDGPAIPIQEIDAKDQGQRASEAVDSGGGPEHLGPEPAEDDEAEQAMPDEAEIASEGQAQP